MFRSSVTVFLSLVISVELAGDARSGTIITTPAGIAPGGQFIVVFVDSVKHSATSSNITDYNNFIQSDASGITYPTGSIGPWQVIGATDTANEAIPLVMSSLPIYDTTGTLISPDGNAVFTGPSGILFDQNGTLQSAAVYTGLTGTGGMSNFADTPERLGDNDVTAGQNDAPQFVPVARVLIYAFPNTSPEDLYGYAAFTASEATTTPEPATLSIALVGLVGLVGTRLAQRRRAAP